jgi:glycosyltransferase involved in cell wall biosynthesis
MAAKTTKTATTKTVGQAGTKAAADAGLSIMVPLYNEARGLEALHQRIVAVARTIKAARTMPVEIVYVDDGSADATATVLHELSPGPVALQVLTLSRNFGKEAALSAGLDHARYGAVLFMDGDGQHPPDLIEKLVARWLDDGYDVVFTAKAHRENEPWLRRAGVHWFYMLLNWRARQKIPEDAGDFRLLSPRAAAALRRMPERNRFFKGLSSWIGFKQVRVDYEPAARTHGVTSWNVWSLIGLSIEGLTSFSVAPLRIASLLGILLAILALIFGGQILVETWIYGKDVPGYPSLFVGMMVLGAVQLIMIGVLGEYIGKLLSEAKARPVYFVAEHNVSEAGDGDAQAESDAASAPKRRRSTRAAE